MRCIWVHWSRQLGGVGLNEESVDMLNLVGERSVWFNGR